MRLRQYVERMQTECDLLGNPQLMRKAIKVDGTKGLKYYLTQDSLKSCDYLKLQKKHMIFIEFSDLNQQFIDLSQKEQQRDNALYSASVPFYSKKMFPKSIDIIHDEINQKISETLVLMTIMEQKFNLSNNVHRTKNFIMGICSAHPRDVQIFDSISRKIMTKYQHILNRVVFLPYEELDTFIITKQGPL